MTYENYMQRRELYHVYSMYIHLRKDTKLIRRTYTSAFENVQGNAVYSYARDC